MTEPLLVVACREFVELVTDYLEHALPPDVERAVVEHLALCPPCLTYLEQVRATSALLGELPQPTLDPATRTELLEVWAQVHPAEG